MDFIISNTDKKMICDVCGKGEITHKVKVYSIDNCEPEKVVSVCEYCKQEINFKKVG